MHSIPIRRSSFQAALQKFSHFTSDETARIGRNSLNGSMKRLGTFELAPYNFFYTLLIVRGVLDLHSVIFRHLCIYGVSVVLGLELATPLFSPTLGGYNF